jgi:hypothetical protein
LKEKKEEVEREEKRREEKKSSWNLFCRFTSLSFSFKKIAHRVADQMEALKCISREKALADKIASEKDSVASKMIFVCCVAISILMCVVYVMVYYDPDNKIKSD